MRFEAHAHIGGALILGGLEMMRYSQLGVPFLLCGFVCLFWNLNGELPRTSCLPEQARSRWMDAAGILLVLLYVLSLLFGPRWLPTVFAAPLVFGVFAHGVAALRVAWRRRDTGENLGASN